MENHAPENPAPENPAHASRKRKANAELALQFKKNQLVKDIIEVSSLKIIFICKNTNTVKPPLGNTSDEGTTLLRGHFF